MPLPAKRVKATTYRRDSPMTYMYSQIVATVSVYASDARSVCYKFLYLKKVPKAPLKVATFLPEIVLAIM